MTLQARHWIVSALFLGLGSGFGCGDDGGGATDASPPDAMQDPVARGEYLVDHVALCVVCHTPKVDGQLDRANYLAGDECFIDVDPNDDDVGCLHTRNLTDHETGLANRSDEEIKKMFTEGVRPNGDVLIHVMPYWIFGNMNESDVDAIIAYLRTVPGVDHQVPNNQPPFDTRPSEPEEPIDLSMVPEPDSSDPNFESAMRGRYIATQASLCIECHTAEPEDGSYPIDMSGLFIGGREFGVPMPPFNQSMVTTPNLTPHSTGLGDYSVEEIVTVIQEGMEMDGNAVCPPMPAGDLAYGGMTDSDATDVAHYLKSLDPVDNDIGGTECDLEQ